MSPMFRVVVAGVVLVGVAVMPLALGQNPQPPEKAEKRDIIIFQDKGPFGPPGGKMGFGGPMSQRRNLVAKFDKDGDKRLNRAERDAAREAMKKEGGNRGPFGKMGGPFGKGRQDPPQPGPHVEPADVKNYPEADLYDPQVLRTIFINFDDKDWEAEMADFYRTDVDVPATMIVDGKTYPDVGVHFRGTSSFFGVPAGYKRSLGISTDFVHKKQALYNYRTLNFLNSHGDPSYMSTILYSTLAADHIPVPRANLVKVVVNGESWGVYVNVEQFNKDFLERNFKTTKGARWKVNGSPGGRGGLEYTGDNIDDYKRHFTIKSKDDDKSWKALINLCKVLNQTPPDQLEEALKPILDVDGLLWFLAIDVAVINSDGYWTRASDYSIYLDPKGKFHIIPHDMNECFHPAMGPGMGGPMMMVQTRPGDVLPRFLRDFLELNDDQNKQIAELQKETDERLKKILSAEQLEKLKSQRDVMAMGGPPGPGGPGGGPMGRPFGGPGGGPGMNPGRGGVELDPLVGIDDPRKPLRSKILAVPKFREQYLRNMRTLAEKSMTWEKLGPVITHYRNLIEKEVEADTRKLDSLNDFRTAMADQPPADGQRGRTTNLKLFIEQRRKFLLNHPEIKKLEAATE